MVGCANSWCLRCRLPPELVEHVTAFELEAELHDHFHTLETARCHFIHINRQLGSTDLVELNSYWLHMVTKPSGGIIHRLAGNDIVCDTLKCKNSWLEYFRHISRTHKLDDPLKYGECSPKEPLSIKFEVLAAYSQKVESTGGDLTDQQQDELVCNMIKFNGCFIIPYINAMKKIYDNL